MRAGARVNEQVVELIEFWETKMEEEGTAKRNKYRSRSAISRGWEEMQG
jgi:hypothetical protein